MPKILFVDDDTNFRDVIAEFLEIEGYQVRVADNASDGLKLFKAEQFDLIISDVKMESIDGLQLLTLIRKLDNSAKVIMLTGSNDEDDEVRGLELHASDFIKKPVSLKVLLTRIERVLKKNKFVVEEELFSRSQNILVEIRNRRVYKDGELVNITMREFDLLVFFLENKGTVLTREQIFKQVWQSNEQFSDIRTVDTHLKKLRAKLKLTCVYSIRGVGYEWAE
ncbi:response regulator transcription factor [Culicoidibacter larvae]|uniref:Response regulator transcription factor n=1 Tax=Culicoidibacter larvae TaxID=2579976 RepID=A0A5R8QC42_9FIRM|nr:response regulator transcription factor [Culicoidibacter larvae]TLG72682.1 response regulator transcription factor [Culicoidibacter larvae]